MDKTDDPDLGLNEKKGMIFLRIMTWEAYLKNVLTLVEDMGLLPWNRKTIPANTPDIAKKMKGQQAGPGTSLRPSNIFIDFNQ